ncbi:MAG: cobalt ECF transporter T component CbiQ [Actinomycetales bacterium]
MSAHGGGLALDRAAWSSPWRLRSVRDKAFLSLGLVCVALVLPTWPGSALVAVVATLVLLGPARVPGRLLARCVAAPAAFIAVGAVSVAVTLSWQDGPRLGVSEQSLAQAGDLVGHALAGTLGVLVLAATTPMVDLLGGLRRVKVPDPLLDVAALMYRMLFALLDSVHAVREAQTARMGYATRRAAMRSGALLTGQVMLRAWTRASRLEEGLSGRGYVEGLTTLEPGRHASARFLAASACVLGLVCALTWGVVR